MGVIDTTAGEARMAGRAIGAMFFFVFGGVWLEGWARTANAGVPVFIAIAVLALLLLGVAWRRYRRYAPALAQQGDTPLRRRQKRVFNIVNAAQWTVIVVLARVLISQGLDAWIIPTAMAIIGLHFLPLAYVFKHPPHYVTGVAMFAFSLLYPLVAAGGPTAPVGFLGAGLILWLSAVWALRARA